MGSSTLSLSSGIRRHADDICESTRVVGHPNDESGEQPMYASTPGNRTTATA